MKRLSIRLGVALSLALFGLPSGGCGGGGGGLFVGPVLDLVAGSRTSPGSIGIYRDFLRHTGFTADVVIEGLGNPSSLAVENDWLVVAERNGNLRVWSSFSTLVNNQAPTAIVATGDARQVALVGGDVYVGSGSQMLIFRDVTTLVTGDLPDVTLNHPAGGNCSGVTVANDILYWSTRNSNGLVTFVGASTLVNGAVPTAQLPISSPRRTYFLDNTLWSQASNGGTYFGWSGANALIDGQPADRAIFGQIDLSDRGSFAGEGSFGYVGRNYYDDEFSAMITRFNFVNTTQAVAEVRRSAQRFERIYDLDVRSNVLAGSDQYQGYCFFYDDAAGIQTNEVPTGFLFDSRLGEIKDVDIIPR